VPESFDREERALDHRVVLDQQMVVPDQFALQCRETSADAEDQNQQAAEGCLLPVLQRAA
jgi:hypothetical protein